MTNALVPKHEWQAMDETRRLQRLLEYSTDRCADYLSMDPLSGTMTAPQMSAQIQVIRAVLHTCVKLGIESKRLADVREQVLGDLIEGLGERAKAAKK